MYGRVTAVDVLEHAKSLIGPKKAWTKHINHILAGELSGDPDAFCSWGAVFRAGHDVGAGPQAKMDAQVAMIQVGLTVGFNDFILTTHRGVRKRFDKAIEVARKNGW